MSNRPSAFSWQRRTTGFSVSQPAGVVVRQIECDRGLHQRPEVRPVTGLVNADHPGHSLLSFAQEPLS